MTDPAHAATERRFLIPVRRTWKLWIWLLLALLALGALLAIVLVPIRTGVKEEALVLGVSGFFVLLVLVQLLLLPTVKVRRPKANRATTAPARPAPVEALDAPADAPEAPAPPATLARGDVEYRLTPEDFKGRRVLELSIPPKAANPGAVYAKAYVAIDAQHVLRVEDLVATKDLT